MSKKTQILKPFRHRFWDDFGRPGNIKNEQKRGRVALYLIFGVCIPFWSRFGGVWGRVLGACWTVLEAFWTILGGFWDFEKESNFEPEVEDRKSGFKDVRGEVRGGSGGP